MFERRIKVRSHNWQGYSLLEEENHSQDKSPGAIQQVNDEFLFPGGECVKSIQNESLVLILPVVGNIEIQKEGEKFEIEPGNLFVLPCHDHEFFRIVNSSEEYSANYLLIKGDFYDTQNIFFPVVFSFDLGVHPNAFSLLWENARVKVSIGKYQGREEDIYHLKKHNHLFTYVIQGAFEVQNRLLEDRDALILRGSENVDFEALSKEGILLFIETVASEI